MISLYVDPVGLIKNKSSSLAELVAEYTMQNTQGGQTLVLEIKLKLASNQMFFMMIQICWCLVSKVGHTICSVMIQVVILTVHVACPTYLTNVFSGYTLY